MNNNNLICFKSILKNIFFFYKMNEFVKGVILMFMDYKQIKNTNIFFLQDNELIQEI